MSRGSRSWRQTIGFTKLDTTTRSGGVKRAPTASSCAGTAQTRALRSHSPATPMKQRLGIDMIVFLERLDRDSRVLCQ